MAVSVRKNLYLPDCAEVLPQLPEPQDLDASRTKDSQSTHWETVGFFS